MSISMTCPITPAQMLAIIDLTMEAAHEVKSSDCLEQDKWVVWEERLKVVDGFGVYDPVREYVWCQI
jgi:hypothetical protein